MYINSCIESNGIHFVIDVSVGMNPWKKLIFLENVLLLPTRGPKSSVHLFLKVELLTCVILIVSLILNGLYCNLK